MKKRNRAVFFDRDGTLIVDKGYLHAPEQVEFFPGLFEALEPLAAEFLFFIVSNQSGLARGYFSKEAADAVHEVIRAAFREAGMALSGIYYCPHGPDEGCPCRKPASGLFLRAAAEHPLDFSRSYMVGDKASDITAGQKLGMKSILIWSEKEGPSARAVCRPDFLAADLAEAARFIGKDL